MTQTQQVKKFHDRAMELADHAFIAKWQGDNTAALPYFEQAYELEAQAAHLMVDTNIEPSRSVLHRSAASLAFNCGKYREAEKLIGIALAGNPPDEVLKELRELMQQVLDAMHEPMAGD
jgi:hypothetical protein